MGDVIRGRFPHAGKAVKVVPIRQPRQALLQVECSPAALPDYCSQCGTILGKDSPSEGKVCPRCGKLHSHASLSADY